MPTNGERYRDKETERQDSEREKEKEKRLSQIPGFSDLFNKDRETDRQTVRETESEREMAFSNPWIL